jgi:hypothetical protein
MYFRELEPVQRDAIRAAAAPVGDTAEPAGDGGTPVARIGLATAPLSGEVSRFQDDDDGYLNWLREHSDGLVVNCERQLRAS